MAHRIDFKVVLFDFLWQHTVGIILFALSAILTARNFDERFADIRWQLIEMGIEPNPLFPSLIHIGRWCICLGAGRDGHSTQQPLGVRVACNIFHSSPVNWKPHMADTLWHSQRRSVDKHTSFHHNIRAQLKSFQTAIAHNNRLAVVAKQRSRECCRLANLSSAACWQYSVMVLPRTFFIFPRSSFNQENTPSLLTVNPLYNLAPSYGNTVLPSCWIFPSGQNLF